MHITYISNENPFDKNNGGIGTYCKYVINMMAKLGNEVSFITIGRCKKEFSYLPGIGVSSKLQRSEHAKENHSCDTSIKVYQIAYEMSSATFPEDIMELFFKKIKQIHNKNQIDIIECQDWLGIGCEIAEFINVPFVTRLHTPLFFVEKIANNQKIYRSSNQIKEFEKLQMKRSTGLSSPCIDLADIVQNEIGIRAEVIPNPIDIRDVNIECIYPKPELVKDKKYFLYLGRLEYRKGVLVLAEVLDEIFSKYPDLILVMCGQDTVYKKRSIKSLIKDKCRQHEDSICFIENAFGEEKNAYIQNAEFIVQPSLWENFSYVTLETMASGKVIVCSNSGGFKEMIEVGKTGFLAEPHSGESLLDEIDKALMSNREKIGKQARNKVVEEYDTTVLGSRFHNYYKTIIKEYESI